jgi:hypothetical protein
LALEPASVQFERYTLNLLDFVPLPVLIGVAAVVGLVILALVARVVFGRRRSKTGDDLAELAINVLGLEAKGPPDAWPQLEFYGVPVRMAVLVLAPAGRLSEIPPREQLRGVMENLMPGLAEVLDRHQPMFRRWPEQLSTHGFAQAFFKHVRLPGDAGKKTPWCSVAGRFDAGDCQLLAGIVCCAASPNAHSTVIVEHAGQWHDVLRIRRSP